MSRSYLVVVGLVMAVVAGSASAAPTFGLDHGVSALRVVSMPTPQLRSERLRTSGTFPQVRSSVLDLGAVNTALRDVVLADQREWPKDSNGQYRTDLDPSLVSASTVVVSVLMPAVIQINPEGPWRHWLSATISVSTGRPVKLRDLFVSDRGVQAFGNGWRTLLPHGQLGCVALDYVGKYSPDASFFRDFALTPNGLAAGITLDGGCSRLLSTVPYRVIRPYLSKLGQRLVAGVRRPIDPYALCHGGSAAKTLTGRSSKTSGTAIFTGSCRYGKWYISAKIDGHPAKRFAVADAKVNGQSPCCGVEILKVVRLPHASPVVLARVALGVLNGFDYDLFTVVRGRVVPVTLERTKTPVVLSTHASAGWGEGFRCLSHRGRLAIDYFRWGANTLDGNGHFKVERWRYTFEPPATIRFQKVAPILVSFKAVNGISSANCFGVRDRV